jgi:starch synthase (maltosyl-transferring)
MIPTVSGTVADWKADLKRVRDMGFNAIHLLPVTTLDTSQSPYAAKDLFDIDHSYLMEGSKQDGLSQLEGYIEEAKTLNIRLCFDLVLNHVGVNGTMARRAPDWIMPDQNQPDGFQRARYWSDQGWRTWNDLVLINYEHPSEAIRSEIWAYMTDYALFWAKYANDTGGFVRFDNLHSSDPDFVQALTATLHAEYPEVGLLAEYFADENTLLRTGPQWGVNLILATPWNCKYVPQLREYLNYIHRVSAHIRYFMPITSHDSGSPAQEFGTADSTVPRYVAAALLGTGATGIPEGVEFGEKERIQFIGRQPKIQYPTEPRFAKFIGRVNAILSAYPAFRRGENCQFVDNGHPAVMAAFRQDTGKQVIGFLVVCNFDTANPQRIMVDLASVLGTDGSFSCRELLSGETQLFPHPHPEILLPPCAAQVLKFSRNAEATPAKTARN